MKAGLKLPLKSLSRHYFWIGDLDLGQLYSVCIIIGLAYIRETRNAEIGQRPVIIINIMKKRRAVRLMTDSLRIISQSLTPDITAGKLSVFLQLILVDVNPARQIERFLNALALSDVLFW